MAFVIQGDAHTKWNGSRDEEGHREYVVTHRVRGNTTDGPANALNTPGLPLPGSMWQIDDDLDQYAWCTWKAKATPVLSDEPCKYFDVEQVFTTKPPPSSLQRCQDIKIEDPLLEPARVSGSFVNYNEEATHDRFGFKIVNSAHEQMRGPQVEFSKNRPRVVIEQNVPSPYLAYILPAMMQNTVNAEPLWGLPVRTILLAEASWERKFYGQCYIYYTRKLTFDIDYLTFDRDLLDEGTKVLHGHWDGATGHWVLDAIDGASPDRFNPSHFDRFKDRNDENMKAILNGAGLPAGVCVDDPFGADFDTGEGDDSTADSFVSIVGPNLGNSLYSSSKWVRLTAQRSVTTPPTTPTTWASTPQYARGNLVTHLGNTYVALATSVNDAPPSANWQILSALTDKGYYSATVTYGTGDYVAENTTAAGTGSLSCEPTTEGNVHVEYYTENDFLALGIPLSF